MKPRASQRRAWGTLAVLLAMVSGAQDKAGLGGATSAAPPEIKEIRPGVLQAGKVTILKNERAISFPVFINMHAGPMEYIVVTPKGKAHESLLRTDADPLHIQVALLLLNAKGAQGKPVPEDPRETIAGEQVEIRLQWVAGGKTQSAPIEQFVRDGRAKKAMEAGPFVYNGSMIFEGQFLAARDGSIVSLITDPAALINNPRPGRVDDENWSPIKAGLPALDSPATLSIRLLPNKPLTPVKKPGDGK